ncbi:cytochrome c oxidase subunit I [Isoalcanivorax indicus]|uniref:cytochrome c oxidase subunit I n=1 Tax=Isoalcanivorax indicus TaxID=2202653 RepID=UPI000DB9C942|nr:cytochrome c oxidase subunit I [Isoalcanivorax indicus]
MTTTAQTREKVWHNPRGWRALTVVSHTNIGKRFMFTGLFFFLVGGLMAMLMRAQLAFPDQDFMSADIYNQLFTMHGTIMMFLFALPMLEGLGMYLVPKLIGARDLAFPRLGAFGYFCYLFGGLILLSSVVLAMAPASGWFMYTPLSSDVYSPGLNSDFWLLGVTFVEIAAVTAGIELMVSILKTRTAGMSLSRMPLMAWYLLVTSVMVVFGFPPLILGSILLELERAGGLAFFDVARGGDPLLWQHLFWLFGHPEVYIIFLPAAGLISTLIPVFARRPIIGYRALVLAVITTGFISFGLWVHHMFTVGIPKLAQAFFSVASMLVAVPTAVQIFAWLATLWAGQPRFSLPMLWVFGFLVIFVFGGLTGVMLALVPFNWQVHDTHFVVAHMHYVLIGGMLFPLIAGIYYYLPLFTGRMPSMQLGRWGFWLTFIGFNVTFLVMHFTGLMGMPRRVYTYEAGLGWDLPNLISSIGGFIMTAGVAMVLLDLVLHGRFGRKAPANPWRGDTLEWSLPLPPPNWNFDTLPTVTSRHPLPVFSSAEPAPVDNGKIWLPDMTHGRRETLGCDPVSGKPLYTVHLPSNSWWPFVCALSLAALCVLLLVRAYPLAAISAVVSVTLLSAWSWYNGPSKAHALGNTDPDQPPLHFRGLDSPGLWGVNSSLLASGSLFMSMLFGWFYLWTVAPLWQFPAQTPLHWPLLLGVALLCSAASWRYRHLMTPPAHGLTRQLLLIAGAGVLALALLISQLLLAPLAVREQAHDAVLLVMLLYLLMHVGVALLATLLQARRAALGLVSAAVPYELPIVRQLWRYAQLVAWALLLVLIAFPLSWGVY